MSFKSYNEFKDSLLKYKNNFYKKIKINLYKEFNFFLTKDNDESFNFNNQSSIKNDFSNYLTFTHNESVFNEFTKDNFNLITDYINNSIKKIKNNYINKIIIVTAKTVYKDDQTINELINELTNLNFNIKIKNLSWYKEDFFYENIFKNVNLKNNISKFENVFSEIDEKLFEDSQNIKLNKNFIDVWEKVFLNKVLMSFEKFTFTLKNFDTNFFQEKTKNFIEELNSNTMIIYLNNHSISNLFKTSFLSNQETFQKIIANDIPIFEIGEEVEYSLINPLVIKRCENVFLFNNYINDFLKNKNNNDNKQLDTLNMYWEDILSEKNLDFVNFNEENNNEDLLKTEVYEKNFDLLKLVNKKKFKLSEHINKFYDDYINEDKIKLLEKTKEMKNIFENYNSLFIDSIKNISLTDENVNKNNIKIFSNKLNEKSIVEFFNFFINNKNSFINKLANKSLSMQELLELYQVYLKINSVLKEIEFINMFF
ncbi:hypothetical protein SGLAD_v1c05050 [Spiroplasma gladiatoris]|uniref:Uncharacterized protein n=1 Tax=Spiroplasma gladiatoris TaxID=2143 RepID=A0A4P7AGZ8_9MOLU|nr:hypothetical protein [Spiroplasma gladiatoris]QBQ07704.1 hypothetical protein SGLAD_v1c05050 [Spiroplasma gladiatoris]